MQASAVVQPALELELERPELEVQPLELALAPAESEVQPLELALAESGGQPLQLALSASALETTAPVWAVETAALASLA